MPAEEVSCPARNPGPGECDLRDIGAAVGGKRTGKRDGIRTGSHLHETDIRSCLVFKRKIAVEQEARTIRRFHKRASRCNPDVAGNIERVIPLCESATRECEGTIDVHGILECPGPSGMTEGDSAKGITAAPDGLAPRGGECSCARAGEAAVDGIRIPRTTDTQSVLPVSQRAVDVEVMRGDGAARPERGTAPDEQFLVCRHCYARG